MPKKSTKTASVEPAIAGSKTLVIAEKPSVATDLAKVLKVPKRDDFFENDEWVISSAVGHLVKLKDPQDLDEKYKRWSLKDLPILPEKYDGSVSSDILKIITGDRQDGSRYKLLKKLIQRPDVGAIVNACDAGREGELILHQIYVLAGRELPIKRLWLTSMTAEAIKDSFAHLLTAEAKAGLLDSAVGRAQADWLVGMNASRFSTIRIGGGRRNESYSIGRVQTPTLMLIVQRELEIRAFQPKTFWKIEATFQVKAGTYKGVAQVPGITDRKEAERFFDEAQAKKLAEESQSIGVGTVTDERKPKKESAPRLFDLTSLQREANRRFGLSAKSTLGAAQALYEKFKAVTYPRTDSQYLPEDYVSNAQNVLSSLSDGHSAGTHAREVLSQGWVKSAGKRVFDNKKVSDHFAIVPTGTIPGEMSEVERKIFDLIVRRFIGVFFPMAEYEETVRTTAVGQHTFRTTGKVLVVAGWRAVWGQEADAEEEKEGSTNLPALQSADGTPPQAKLEAVETKQDATKPPARYNEASLLGAMENAGKLVEDEALAEAMKERGLGTPATRAQTIEGLLNNQYIERQGKELVPLAKAFQLHQFIHAKGLAFISEPQLTGEWEYQLKQIEHGDLSVKKFIQDIKDQVRIMVEKGSAEVPPTVVQPEILSPTDHKPLLTNGESYFSQDRSADGKKPMLIVYAGINGHTVTPAELAELIAKRRIGPFHDFKSMKSGKNFTGFIDLVDEDSIVSWKDKPATTSDEGEAKPKRKTKPKPPSGRLKAILHLPPREGVDGNPDAFDADWPVLGLCPISGLPVQQTPSAGYRVCPQKALAAGAKKTFSLNAEMLKASITPEDVKSLLNQGKTPLKKFISRRTNRGFEAFLVADKSKGWWFEFPPRKPKAGKKAAVDSDAKSSDGNPF
jgi:DNA topoisomerase-3